MKPIRVLGVCLLALFAASDAEAARRGVRVDVGNQWTVHENIAECSGASESSTLIQFGVYTLSGREDAAYLLDSFCETSNGSDFNDGSFVFGDESGLQTLVGANVDGAITATRYAHLDVARSDSGHTATGFQWGIYRFPAKGAVIVGLYGFGGFSTPLALDARTYLKQGTAVLWSAAGNNFDGDYFCFVDGRYVGLWNGNTSQVGACMNAFKRVFINDFE